MGEHEAGGRAGNPDAPFWRAMDARDIAAVDALSAAVHPAYPEREAVLREKLVLSPSGCFALEVSGSTAGYCFSHPWTAGAPPPALDTFLERLPQPATSWFVHDLTLAPQLRGRGLGAALVPRLEAAARGAGLAHMSLVAVNGRGPFWEAAGFSASADEPLQAAARARYGDGALHMQRRLAGAVP